jgi:hypothetical protein
MKADDLREGSTVRQSEPEATPDPYAVLHKYMDAYRNGQMFVIADADMAEFYDQQCLHYKNWCARCDVVDGGTDK